MIENRKLLLMSLTAVTILGYTITNIQLVTAKKENFFERPSILPRHILEARGYLAKDFDLISEDGYRIRITRGRNPLINQGQGGLPGRVPILFIHGIFEDFTVFVVNSFDVRPSDFSKINIKGVPLTQLNAKLGDVPSAKSLPLLAMDFGHEVFIMSRRGFPGSQAKLGDPNQGVTDEAAGQHVPGPFSNLWHGLTNYGHFAEEMRFSLDRKFWNFSADEQARYDWPLVVNFVREHTKRDKIAVVAHSIGATICLMALSMFPELNEKIAAAVFWSQAFTVGHRDVPKLIGAALVPLLHHYVGPLPPAPVTGPLQRALNIFCASRLMQRTVCEVLADFTMGYTGGQAPMRPEFVNSCFYTSSSHEVGQLLQMTLLNGQMHHYSWNGLKHAKPYNVSRVTTTKLSFYSALTDSLVSPADLKATLPLLRVPYRTHTIKQPFNHNSYFYHLNTSRLAIIPSLQDIHELSEGPSVWTPANRVALNGKRAPVANTNATVTVARQLR